ncbi:AMP-binding protein [Tomitella cavernea]|uniref:AMP-binding protein n=1 Tax=Tomitella cavernea TaxID=1387982 RepID=A0ABP9C3P0_9ACTN|nr:AMP-binding protein [Tomitella cavernea]
METFAEVVRTRSGDSREGLRFEGRSWTWDAVVRESAARAALLRDFVQPGAGRAQRHVGILLQNVPDYVFWLLGAALNGDVIVGVNSTRKGVGLRHDIEHADCDMVITEPLFLESTAVEDLGVAPERILDVESEAYAARLDEYAGAPVPDTLPDPSDIFLLLFSSGSTGAPKAVICTNGRLGRLTEKMGERISLHRDSVTYLMLPLFHGHAIMMNLCTAAKEGATVVMVRKFSASAFVEDIRRHKVTFFNYVGRALSYILAVPRDPAESDNSLEVAFGSEASPAEVDEFKERFGCEVREGYGASEGAIRIVPVPGSPRNALGLPASGMRAEVRDDDNVECPPARFDSRGVLLNAEEATGEIVVLGRGATFEGYYKNPEAMADRLKFGGEDFWTGDLAYRDGDGYFYFAGRGSDWLRVDGENFGAAPVERILSRYPAFAGAHILAVPDPKTGDQVMCVVTMAPDARFDPEDFAAFVDAQPDMGTKWRPAFLRVVDEVPMTGSGKINKAPLRATAWEADDVWYAPSRASGYTLMSVADRAALRDQFVAGGRENVMPADSRRLLTEAAE